MSESKFVFITDEINFYMEKQFQFSFVYIGALFATLAGVQIELFNSIASLLQTEVTLLALLLISVLNFVFLIIMTSSGYAVLKRGLFIIENAKDENIPLLSNWERFTRMSHGNINGLAWNIDNYYAALLYIVGLISSLGIFLYSIPNSFGIIRVLFIVIAILNLIPIWSLFQLSKLNNKCREKLL